MIRIGCCWCGGIVSSRSRGGGNFQAGSWIRAREVPRLRAVRPWRKRAGVLGVWWRLGVFSRWPGRRVWGKVGEPADPVEASMVAWVPLSDVPELIARGEVAGSGSLVGLLYALAVPGRI